MTGAIAIKCHKNAVLVTQLLAKFLELFLISTSSRPAGALFGLDHQEVLILFASAVDDDVRVYGLSIRIVSVALLSPRAAKPLRHKLRPNPIVFAIHVPPSKVFLKVLGQFVRDRPFVNVISQEESVCPPQFFFGFSKPRFHVPELHRFLPPSVHIIASASRLGRAALFPGAEIWLFASSTGLFIGEPC